MGIMRWTLFERLKKAHPELSVRNTYGYLTKHKRISHGIAKSHCADAYCIADNLGAKRLSGYLFQKQTRKAVISKFPIKETERINKWMFKAILDVSGKRVAVYPAHSEYRYYTCYYPRGYNDGSVNWDKLPAPITDVDKILSVCEESDRITAYCGVTDGVSLR